MELRDYEKEILQEIADWEARERTSGLFGLLSAAAALPVQLIFQTKAAQSALEAMSDAIYSFLNKIYGLSGRTFKPTAVLERLAEEEEIKVGTVAELQDCDIRKLDRVVRQIFGSHAIVASLEGAGCGLGGLALIAADIPVLLGVNFRMIRQIGTVYGYDTTAEAEVDIALKIIQIAASTPQERQSGLLEIDTLTETIRTAGAKFGMYAGVLAMQRFSRLLGEALARRKLGQLIPLVGAGIGAGINYRFTSEVGETAYMVYRKRFLKDKQLRTPTGAATNPEE
jgi:uncharacterized protein (DUF697 family)